MTAVLDRPAPGTPEWLAELTASDVKGVTTPRLWTRPLTRPGRKGRCGCGCNLTEKTTLGFKVVRFAEELAGQELYPWQRFWLIHALELLDDGSFRFKTIITLVSRQNGKTFLLKILALYFIYMKDGQLVVGAAQALDIAKESWMGAVQLAQGDEELNAEIAPNGVRLANGEQCLTLENGSRYRITATTPGAARGLSVDLLILDELRMQHNWLAWGALSKTTTARPNSLIVGISNAGDDRSVVLNTLRSRALSGQDPQTGIFEWSAESDASLDDVAALAQSNPALGYSISLATLQSFRQLEPRNVFLTESMCVQVDTLDSAIDVAGWKGGARSGLTLEPLRDRIAYCIDVAPDGQHVTLAGAAMSGDGVLNVQLFGAWPSTEAARVELGELFAALRPRALGWFPTGPAAVFAPDLDTYQGDVLGRLTVNRREYLDWAPGAVELTGNTVPILCQSFADVVQNHQLVHPDDPLLNAHVNGSQRKDAGDGWRFVRRGAGHVDAAYAVAGAVHLARTLPIPRKRVKPKVF
jgi:hypothetical protein